MMQSIKLAVFIVISLICVLYVYENMIAEFTKVRSISTADHRKWLDALRRYIKVPLSHTFGSHIVPLLAAVHGTGKGAVFEMGCGYFSTPMLHRISKESNRFILSTDTDKNWLGKFSNLSSPLHDFKFVPVYSDHIGCFDKKVECTMNGSKWDEFGNDRHWSVVFVDHRPGRRRIVDVARFYGIADVIIVHDTEQATYGWQPKMSAFKYVFRWGYVEKTHTSIVTHRLDVFQRIVMLLILSESYLNENMSPVIKEKHKK